MIDGKPFIVGLGGTQRPNSSSEAVLRGVLASAEKLGASTWLAPRSTLDVPVFSPENAVRSEPIQEFLEKLRLSDAIIIASPGYHGSISGAVKNLLDYTEDLREDERPYFDGRAVGCIAVGAGWQGANTTLSSLRDVVHALRGWPTPLGIAINSAQPRDKDKEAVVEAYMAEQLCNFAKNFS